MKYIQPIFSRLIPVRSGGRHWECTRSIILHKHVPLTGLFLPLIFLLMFTAATGGCGDEQTVPVSRIRLESFDAQTATISQQFFVRLSQAVVQLPAKNLLRQSQAGRSIGLIELPRIGVMERIIEGSSTASLEKGAGHIEGTSVPGLGGNFAIAGDRVLYSAPFLRLDQMEVGDNVVIHMAYADFTYQVESKTNVDPTDVGVLKARGYDSLTLSTCDPPWDLQTRIIVSGRLIKTTPGGITGAS